MGQFFVYASCSSFRSSVLCFIFYFLPASEKGWSICKADIRNPLSLLAHERSRFATCQWELLTPTDISIPLTHRLVLYALEAGECLFCVHKVNQRAQHSVKFVTIYMCTWHAVPSCKWNKDEKTPMQGDRRISVIGASIARPRECV